LPEIQTPLKGLLVFSGENFSVVPFVMETWVWV
jgi:hypothetical protein